MAILEVRRFFPVRSLLDRIRSRLPGGIRKKPFGLKTKITLLIVVIVAGVLLFSSYLDYHLSRRDQIDLYLNRNIYIAKQIDLGIPDPRNPNHLPRIEEEIEEWLLSRSFLMAIDLFLFSPKGWRPLASYSKSDEPLPLTLSTDQISRLKKDMDTFLLREVNGESWLEVIVPLHASKRVVGGIRLASTLEEAQSYLGRRRNRVLILSVSSILLILATLTLSFRKLVGRPIEQLVAAMSRAEKGDLKAEVTIQAKDELGEVGRHFNRMLRTIHEAHQQNIQLLSQVQHFNEELTRKIEAATAELARRNEELKLLNKALFESQRQLSRSEKLAALGQVTAALAHQIGTPLNSISGYLQLILQEGDLRPQDRERLKIIESQLDRLADSVKNMLSFTQAPRPQLQPLDVNSVLEELMALSEPWLHARKVKMTASLSREVPKVLGDATQLQMLFLNLMTNAVDAMPQGGDLTVRTRRAEGDGTWVEVSIGDTGIGITEETKKRIFDPFFTTKRIGEGTGLGLAICEKIVKEHFGRLKVESRVGEGSIFSVFLPALEERQSLRTGERAVTNDGRGVR